MRGLRFAFALAGMLMPFAASAETPRWLEWIRDYDLNDYSLGVSVLTSQSPYANAKNSVWAYPYLTSFRHSSMTDDWLLFRGGGIGFRGISSAGWEFGLFGRINTGGLGNGDPEELRGLREREWAIDAGPFVGWRGWPVHINLDTYYEITNRHDGYSAELRFSLPREYRWGHLVPSVELDYANDSFNDYYFGVSPAEVRPGRPEYFAGADTNVRAKLQYGYRLGEKWLISGSVSAEWLGDEITRSPIVDRDRVPSIDVGLAYNADIFNPREFPYPDYRSPAIDLRIGGFWDNVSTEARRTDTDGIPGDVVEFENTLDGADAKWVGYGDVFFRIGQFHRFELSYFELGRDSRLIASGDIDFGELEIPAGTELTSRSDFSSLVTAYSYSLMKDAQKEFGVTAGLHFTSFDTIIEIVGGDREEIDEEVTLPVIGAHGSVALGERMRLAARLQIFGADVNRYEGNMYFATLDLTREFSEKLRLGLGFNYYDIRLSSSRESFRGDFQTRHFGPVLFLSVAL